MSASVDQIQPCPLDIYLQPIDNHGYEEIPFRDNFRHKNAVFKMEKNEVDEQIHDSYPYRMRKFTRKRTMAILFSVLFSMQLATWGLLGYYVLRFQGPNGESTEPMSKLPTVLKLFQEEMTSSEFSKGKEIREEIDKLESKINSLKVPTTPAVAFFAFRILDVSPGIYKKLIFQNTFINTNNSYNKTSGEFIVPVQGLYWFSARICRRENTKLDFGIVVNENRTSSNHIYASDSIDCRALNVVVLLKPDDRVCVKTGDATDDGEVILQYYNTNTFMGALIS